jgi:hypothetical protein
LTSKEPPNASIRSRSRTRLKEIESRKPERSQDYADTLDATVRVQVFGQPSEEMLAALKQQAGEGVEISLHSEHLGGFTRISN